MTINEITPIELLEIELKHITMNLDWSARLYSEGVMCKEELCAIADKVAPRIYQYEQAIKKLLK